ncbi:hypothetical protein JK185_13905 [Gluconobacter wancherniae]|uniref:hypothetical protein n=1 Tax=Gluconobacter wancherniae TaxID=1307955 RepID=UPI001B8CD660|nr:hypothetical protein [Gluconobacter wancherniae]MBS1064099.1 hypothetical protein [Gluconobacter wancherniae]
MTGITGLDATTLTQRSLTDQTNSLTAGSPAPGDDQVAFLQSTPARQTYQTQSISTTDTLGDQILSGLGRISSAFSTLNTLAPTVIPTTGPEHPALSQSSVGTPGLSGAASAISSGKTDEKTTPLNSLFEKVEQEGIAMYNEALTRQMAFTNSEFETHIITVSSQNMTSTLKSLLTQGG